MSHDDQQFQLGKASGTGNRLKSRRVSFVTKRWRDEDTKKQKKKKTPKIQPKPNGMEQAPELVWTKLYLLQRAVAAECGDYDGPWMSPAEVERARHLLRRTAAAEEPLGPGLAAALPATVHLLDGCWTRTGHWIGQSLHRRMAMPHRPAISYSQYHRKKNIENPI